MSQQSEELDGGIDLIDGALKHLEQDSTMSNSRKNGISPGTSSYHRKFDLDLDLVQCPPSPTSTTFNSTDFNQIRSSPPLLTGDSGNLNYSNSPTNRTKVHSPVPSIASFERKQDKNMSPQNKHNRNNKTMLNSDGLRKTALTNSRHGAPGIIDTHNRQGHPCAIDLTPVMSAFPDMAEDLYDWLVLTGWHDVAHRTREINQHRKLEALEKQQTSIEFEKAALLRSYHREKNGSNQRSETLDTSHPIMSDTYSSSSPQRRHDLFPDALEDVAMAQPDQDGDAPANNFNYQTGAKRGEKHLVSSKLTKTGRRPSAARPGRDRSASPRGFQRNGRSDYHAYRERDVSRVQNGGRTQVNSPPNAPSHRPLQSRITRPEGRDNRGRPDLFAERREHRDELESRDKFRKPGHDDFSPQRDRERERMNAAYPRHIDISRRGDTRFFVMKSYNLGNIYDCQDEGLWATQTQNEATLRKAFEETKNVILFFSANRSHAFMGYARMTTAPSAEAARPRWWPAISWKITEPFGVEWASKMHCDDAHLKHIRNALNEGLPITRARDGQEIEEYAGREMVAILNARAVREADRLGDGR